MGTTYKDYQSIEDFLKNADKAVIEAFNGIESQKRAGNLTTNKGKLDSEIAQIKSAMISTGGSTVGAKFKQVTDILQKSGIDLKVRTQKVGDNTMLQLVPIPYGDKDFYKNHDMNELVWNLPIATNGTILFDRQQRNDILQAASDESGNIRLLSAAQVALNNILTELQTQASMNIINAMKSSEKSTAAKGAKDLARILNTSTRSAVQVGNAVSQYNAAALKDLEKALKLEGSQQRQNVTKSGVYLADAFQNLLKKHYAGKGDFAEQTLKRDQATRLINEMGLIIRSLGVEKGYQVINRNSKFAPILKDYRLAIPVLRGIGQIAAMGLAEGPVSDTNGLTMGYLNDMDSVFNFLLPKHSRKAYQTSLVDLNYFNNKRSKAFTKGSRLFSAYGNDSIKDKNAKAYDTTRFIQVTQDEFTQALQMRVDDLKGQLKAAETKIKANPKDQKLLSQIEGLRQRINRAEKQKTLSIKNGALILDRERAEEIAASNTVTKNLSNELIKHYYDQNIQKLQKNNKGKKLKKEDRLDALTDAVRTAMSKEVTDLETYNRKTDIISYGEQDSLRRRNRTKNNTYKRYLDQVDKFYNDFTNTNFDINGKTAFSIRQGVNAPQVAQGKKYVGMGTTLRSLADYLDVENDILPYIGILRGKGKNYFKGKSITGIMEKSTPKSKNIMDLASGVFFDMIGRAGSIDSKDIKTAVMAELPPELRSTFSKMFKATPNGLQRVGYSDKTRETFTQFKKYLPAMIQAASLTFGGDAALSYTVGNTPVNFSTTDVYEIINGKKSIKDLSTQAQKELAAIGFNGDVSLKKLGKEINVDSAENALLAVQLAQHSSKPYGMPLSKGGTPVQYSSREFNSLMALLNLTSALNPQSQNILETQNYYKDLSKQTIMSRQRYEGLLNFHNMAQMLTRDINTNESNITAHKGTFFTINKDIVNKYKNLTHKGIFDTDVRSASSDLPKLQELEKLIIADIRAEQLKHFDTLSDEEQAELIAQAGGEEYINQVKKDLMNTSQFKGKNVSDDILTREAKRQAGASFVPVAVSVEDANGEKMLFASKEDQMGGKYMVLPHFDYNIREDLLPGQDVVNLGANGNGILSFLNSIINSMSGGINGTNKQQTTQKIAQRLRTLYGEDYDQLTRKDASIYEEATKVAMNHSVQAKVEDFQKADIEYQKIINQVAGAKNITTQQLEAYAQNAVVISGKMFDQLLQPTKDEVEGWTDQLTNYYADVLGVTAKEARAAIDTDVEKYITAKNLDRTNDDDKAKIDRATQYLLKKRLRDAITLGKGNETTLSRGMTVLLNRFPSLLGDKDVLASKLLINPLWSKQQHSLVGGDDSLIRLLNADFDGDTLVAALANGRSSKNLAGMREMVDTVSDLTAFERLFRDKIFPTNKSSKETLTSWITPEETEARDTYLAKTGKAYVGMFSNVRQGFMNALSGQSSDYSTADNAQFSGALNLLGHFLGIFEQGTISSKKMTSAQVAGFESNLSDLYSMVKDKRSWGTWQGVANIIKKAQNAGILQEDDAGELGLFTDEQSQVRLGILPIAETLLLAKSNLGKGQKGKTFINKLGALFGLSSKELDDTFFNNIALNDKHQFVDEDAAVKALQNVGLTKITTKTLENAYNIADKYIRNNPITKQTEYGDIVELKTLADAIGFKRSFLPRSGVSYQSQYNSWLVGKGRGENNTFTDQQVQDLIAAGAIVAKDKLSYMVTPEAAEQWRSALLKQEEEEASQTLGEDILNPRKMAANIRSRFANFAKENKTLNYTSTSNTPTRILGRTFPYYSNKPQYNYEDQLKEIEEATAKNTLAAFSDEQRAAFLKSHNIIEKGNIAHGVAQGILDNISEDNLKLLFSDGNGGIFVPASLTNKNIANLNKVIADFDAAPSTSAEDHGGVGHQINTFKELVKKYGTEEEKAAVNTRMNDTQLHGVAMASTILKRAGIIDASGRFNKKALDSFSAISEVGLIGALTSSGESHGRIDLSTLNLAERPSAYGWMETAKKAAGLQLLDNDSTPQSKAELINQLQKNRGINPKQAKALLSELDTDTEQKIVWTIGDFKTASGETKTPTATNTLQLLSYATMAEALQENLDTILSDGDKSRIAKIRAEYKDRGKLTIQNKKELNDIISNFATNPAGGADIYQGMLAATIGENADKNATKIGRTKVEDFLRQAMMAEELDTIFAKAGDRGDTELFRFNYKAAKADPVIRSFLQKMYSNSWAPALNEEETLALEARAQQYTTLVEESQGALSHDQIAKQKSDVHKATSIFKSKAKRLMLLQEKRANKSISDKEATELEQLESEGLVLGKEGSFANAVIDSLKLNTTNADTLEQMLIDGAGVSPAEAKTLSQSIFTNQPTAKADVIRTLLSVADNEYYQTKRAKGYGLNNWLKAQKENLKYNTAIQDLTLKKQGLEKAGKNTSEIEEQINQLRDAIKENDNIISEQARIHGTVNGKTTYGEETELWKDYNAKFNAYASLQKKEGIYDKADALVQLQLKKNSLLQQQESIEAQLNNADIKLTDQERAQLGLQLEQIKDTLATEIDNYLDSYRQAIEDELKAGKLTQDQKDALQTRLDTVAKTIQDPAYAKQLATGQAALAGLTGVQQRQAGAFSAYNNYNSVLFDMQRNNEAIKKTTDPIQARLLQIEQTELTTRLQVAEKEKQLYELQSTQEGKADQNALEKEKADLLLQQRLNALNNKPGIIDKVENKTMGLLAGIVKGYGLHRVLNRLIQTVRQLVAQAVNLDKVLANLRIVTGDSKNNTRALISEYAALGKAIGATTTEVASSAVEWLRQGYETAEVLNLVKSSMYLSKLGMMDASTATQSLTSALKGFKLQASESMDVVDKLTAIDMKAATSAGEIAQGLAQFANLGSLMGVNIDQAAAYVATISDVTQMSGSSAGQALKTIISRYGNVKAGAYSKLNTESETSDENTNLNDVERVLNKIGISIRKNNLEFKDFDEVLEAVAEKWKTLDNVSKKAVATAFAGIRQQEAFTTLLQNWDKYQDLLEVSETSKGTAEKKYGNAYKESFEAAKNSFTAALEDFMNKSEVNDLLTKIVKFMTKLVDNLPKILKALTQLFFAIQQGRSLSGKSLIGKGARALMGWGQNAINGMRGLSVNNFVGSRFTANGQLVTGSNNIGIGRRIGNWLGVNGGATSVVDSPLMTTWGSEDAVKSFLFDNKAIGAQSLSAGALDAAKNGNYGLAMQEVSRKQVRAWNKVNPNAKVHKTMSPKAAGVASGVMAGVEMGMNQVLAGLTAYEMTGQTHKNAAGKEVQSSDAARKRGGEIAMAWATMVPFIGSYIGDKMAQKTMSRIDAVRDAVNAAGEQASKIVSAMNSITGNVDTLTDLADNDNYDSKKVAEAIEGITAQLYTEENKDARMELQNHLSGSSLYEVLDKYQHGTEEQRKSAARQLKLATLQTEHENNQKAREASLFNQRNNEVSKDRYLAYRKASAAYDTNSNIDSETGLDKSTLSHIKSNLKGVGAAEAVGGALSAAGMGIMIGTSWSGVGALIGGVMAGLGTVVGTVGAAAIGIKETQAAIAEEQEKLFEEFNNKGIFEQEQELKQIRATVMSVGGDVSSIDALLNDISDSVSLIYQQMKEYNKEQIQEAILQTKAGDKYLDEMTLDELKSLGVTEIMDLVANQMGEAFQGYFVRTNGGTGEISTYAENLLLEALRENPLIESVISGGAYTLSEALERYNNKPNDPYEKQRVQNFATALGVTTEELGGLEGRYGMLRLSELLNSTAENITSLNEYHSLLSSIADRSKSTSEWMSQIIAKYPDLLAYMSDTPTLIEKIMQKMRGLASAQFMMQWTEIARDATFYNQLKKEQILPAATEIGMGEEITALINGSGATNFNDLLNYVLGNQKRPGATELLNILQKVGEDYQLVSDAYKEQLTNYFNVNSKILEDQINNLNQQKEALQQINKQREYENQLVEAKLKLENAINEKQRVYRAGVGFVYEADQGAISKAQEEIDNLQVDKQISALDKQTQLLQTIKDEFDTAYEKESLEIQRETAKKFSEQILGGDTGFGKYNSLAAGIAAIGGATTTMAEITQQQVNEKKEAQSKAATSAAEALEAYIANPEGGTGIEAYNKFISAKNALVDLGVGNDDLEQQILAHATDQEAAKAMIKQIVDSELGGSLAGAEYNNTPTKDQFDVYEFDGKQLRTSLLSEKSGSDAKQAQYVMQDVLTSSAGNYIAGTSADWANSTSRAAEVRYYNENGEQQGGGIGFRTAVKADGAATIDKTKKLETYKKFYENHDVTGFASAFVGDADIPQGGFAIIRGANGQSEYLLINSSGTAQVLREWTPTDKDKRFRGRTWTHNNFKEGTLSTPSLINELGTEAIITPSGTITALPSRTGIVPADITKNLWALGEVAPAILRLIGPSIAPDHIGSSQADVVDESFNINSLTMNVTADESFDADAFVDSIKTRANLTKNIRRS